LYFFFEVKDPDSEGYGEAVYTTLSERAMPLIRYRSSDLTTLVDSPCGCGISMGRIAKIRARCDEMVVCGMGNVGPWVFDEVLRGISGIRDDWQVVIRQSGSRDRVELHVEAEDPLRQATIEHNIHANLRDRFADFWRNRDLQLYELRVVFHRVGSLRGDARKLRRLIDERNMSQAVPALSV
jgi:phenylacetate-CoA ligase